VKYSTIIGQIAVDYRCISTIKNPVFCNCIHHKRTEATMPKQVLIVEDDIALRRLFSSVLSHSDCDVFEATSCATAQDQLSKRSYDMVVCDIHLTDGDTIDIMSLCCEQNMSVVAISSDDSYIKPLKQMGVNAFMVKPVSVGDLMQLVENFDDIATYQTIWYPD
jgi:DNA-binding NtrC family response regulator